MINSDKRTLSLPEQDIYELLNDTKSPIIIYGMGNGADKIINELENRRIPVCGVAASDDFVRGQSFRGFKVQKISEVLEVYPNPIIIIAFGTALPEVMERIFALSEKITVLAADVPVYGDNIWCRGFYEENKEDIEKTHELLADEQSRLVFENILHFKLTGRLSYLRKAYSDKREVFSEILCLDAEESYLDLGAYRGDTIDEFLRYTDGSYSHITALEPDRKNFAKLKQHTAGMENVRLFRMGIWSEDRDMYFSDALGRGSSLRENGGASLAVTKIDTLYAVRKLTYLKMDVEGSERQALLGGIHTLRRDMPKLNIAVYHRSEDIFSLPLLIHSIVPEYRIYLRQHPYIPAWDLNMYCVKNG